MTAVAHDPTRDALLPLNDEAQAAQTHQESSWWPRLTARLKAEKTRRMLRRKAVAAWMNVLILIAAGVTAITAGFLNTQPWPVSATWAPGALKLFTLWCLAFLPGWLYIRFLDVRAKALWNEYVLTLHRLGWDRPGNLPEPLRSSSFTRTGTPTAAARWNPRITSTGRSSRPTTGATS